MVIKSENLVDYNGKKSINFPLKCVDYVLFDSKLYLLCECEKGNKYIILIEIYRMWITCCCCCDDEIEIKQETIHFPSGLNYSTDLFSRFIKDQIYQSHPLKFTIDNIQSMIGKNIHCVKSEFRSETIACKATAYNNFNETETTEYLDIDIELENETVKIHSNFPSYSDGLYTKLVIVPV